MQKNMNIIGLVLLMIAGATLPGKSTDRCLIHMDKSYYVSGEYIWYHTYLPASFANRRVAVKVTMHNQSGEEISHHFNRSEGQQGFSGYYKIPFDQQTGIYVLAFSVYAPQTKQTRILGAVDIPIFNDLAPVSASQVEFEDIATSVPLGLDINGQLTDTEIEGRDIVDLKMAITGNGEPVEALVSVAVVDAELIPGATPTLHLGDQFELHPLDILDSSLFYTGTLSDAEGNALQANVLGAYAGSDQKIYYTKSGPDGRFVLRIPDFHEEKSVQFLGYYKEELEIRAHLDKLHIKPKVDQVTYTEEVVKYIELSRLRKKVYQLYTGFETQLNLPEFNNSSREPESDLTYQIKEYENFDDVRAFFGELVTPLTFRLSKDSVYSAVLYNTKARGVRNTFLTGTPLFIVDDKVTHDADYVARMSLSPVETVELFVDPLKLRRDFQAIGMSGVVRLRTQLKDAPMPETSEEDRYLITGLQQQAMFPQMQPSASDRQPVFRPLVYWSAGHGSDQRGSVGYQFRHSDDIGKFKIHVVAQSKDGAWGHTTIPYQATRRFN